MEHLWTAPGSRCAHCDLAIYFITFTRLPEQFPLPIVCDQCGTICRLNADGSLGIADKALLDRYPTLKPWLKNRQEEIYFKIKQWG